MDDGTPVSEDYKLRDNKFTGKIHRITIDLKEMKAASAEDDRLVIHEAHVRKQLAD